MEVRSQLVINEERALKGGKPKVQCNIHMKKSFGRRRASFLAKSFHSSLLKIRRVTLNVVLSGGKARSSLPSRLPVIASAVHEFFGIASLITYHLLPTEELIVEATMKHD